VHRFSLAAQFLHAGAYRREIVGSMRPVHVSFHSLHRVLMALFGPRPALGDRKMVNFARQVSGELM